MAAMAPWESEKMDVWAEHKMVPKASAYNSATYEDPLPGGFIIAAEPLGRRTADPISPVRGSYEPSVKIWVGGRGARWGMEE
jgi:hypothetical protein